MGSVVTVTFEPGGETVAVPAGTTVLEAARRAGVPLASTCGGKGTCGDCAVRVLAGDVAGPGPTESAALASAPSGVRLACLLRADSPLTVRPVAPVSPVAAEPAPGAGGARAARCAVDLGTTSISAAALDGTGAELAVATAPNPQRTFGGDVASRISGALAGRAGDLRALAARGIDEALAATGARLDTVDRVVVAGNTAMAHLALEAEVAGLAEHPYAGSLAGVSVLSAAGLGLMTVPRSAEVLFLPPIAGFVGGDTTAGILATGLDRDAGVRVLLDLGTNAEVVVAVDGALSVSSAAAGPAFEAAGLACGSPAIAGAVRDARVHDGDLVVEVVGGGEAASLCGSGALALVAALLAAGHLDASGRMRADGPLRARLHHRGDVLALQVSGEPGGERDVYLTQLDVRELQLAKAAVATALRFTLEAAGTGWDAVAEVLLAGAFGAGLDGAVLRALGVLPDRAIPVTAAGDTALLGAEAVAADPAQLPRAEAIASSARRVDLATQPGFQEEFLANTELRPRP